MRMFLASAALPLLRRFDAERAHTIALAALRLGLAGYDTALDEPALSVEALGLRFSNPIGLAAGFDKNAVAIAPLAGLGFGFVEAGTVTPLPQSGNPRPRLFRLSQDRAVINRMGFNNLGLEAYLRRLEKLKDRTKPVGANVGINKTGADPLRDYPMLVSKVSPHADYIVLNVSSPNTPGLRDLQGEAQLRGILHAIATEIPVHPPLLVKIAPDLSDSGIDAVVDTVMEAGVQGLIVSNTTVTRPDGLRSSHARQAGGLSGAPLFAPSTRALARVARRSAGRLVLIGCGGIASGADVLAKIRAGAHLVQVYTAFAYDGPALIPRLKTELAAALRAQGYRSVTDARGADAL